MSDPITTLESLKPESPPEEAVLASLRLFRYRALAAVALVVALVMALTLVARATLGSSQDDDVRDVVDDASASFEPATGSAMIGMVAVTATEVASADSGSAVRLIFVDMGTPERQVDLDVSAVRQGGGEAGPVVSIPSLGREAGRNSTAVWVPLDERLDPFGAAIEILVMPIPDFILEEGGELSSDDGFTGVVTIERKTSP